MVPFNNPFYYFYPAELPDVFLENKPTHTSEEEWTPLFAADKRAIQQRIVEGDEEAFAKLFHHYYTVLRPFVLKFTQSSSETEDILQETFIRIWLSRDKLPEIDNLQSWIFTIASRQCLMYLRKDLTNRRKKEASAWQQKANRVMETPADATEVAEITRIVAEAVNQMPPQRQRIYRMSREDGLKPAAIAEALDLSVHTVKNVLVTALKEIRDHLTDSGHWISLLYLLVHFL